MAARFTRPFSVPPRSLPSHKFVMVERLLTTQVFIQPRHDFHEIAGHMPIIELF